MSAKLKRERSTHEGQHGQVVAPTQDAIREAIEAGKCPWCGRGPYALLAMHTNKAHGVDRFELRDLSGLTYNTRICDPDLAARLSERSKRNGSGGAIRPTQPRKSPRINEAARKVLRENGRRMTFEERSAAGKIGGLIGGKTRGEQMKKPRQSCVVCEGEIPFIPGNTTWKTCSPECRRVNKAAATKASRAKRRSEFCKDGHPLSGDNLKVIPHGNGTKRVCLACQRAAGRRYRARQSGGGA